MYKYKFSTNDWYRPLSFLNNKIDTYVNSSGVARVTGARGPPPSKIFFKMHDIEMYIASIQLIMCVIISRSLHVYFTTFDMILKYILTYM